MNKVFECLTFTVTIIVLACFVLIPVAHDLWLKMMTEANAFAPCYVQATCPKFKQLLEDVEKLKAQIK